MDAVFANARRHKWDQAVASLCATINFDAFVHVADRRRAYARAWIRAVAVATRLSNRDHFDAIMERVLAACDKQWRFHVDNYSNMDAQWRHLSRARALVCFDATRGLFILSPVTGMFAVLRAPSAVSALVSENGERVVFRDAHARAHVCSLDDQTESVKHLFTVDKWQNAKSFFTRDAKALISLDKNGRLTSRNAQTGASEVYHCVERNVPFCRAVISDDQSRLFLLYADGVVLAFDVERRKRVARLHVDFAPDDSDNVLAFASSDGALFVTGVDGNFYVWNVDRGQVAARIACPTRGAEFVTFTPDNLHCAIVMERRDGGRQLLLFDVQSAKLKKSIVSAQDSPRIPILVHLLNTYGLRAFEMQHVAEFAENKRLSSSHRFPVIEALFSAEDCFVGKTLVKTPRKDSFIFEIVIELWNF